jgi:hypothetical protein
MARFSMLRVLWDNSSGPKPRPSNIPSLLRGPLVSDDLAVVRHRGERDQHNLAA